MKFHALAMLTTRLSRFFQICNFEPIKCVNSIELSLSKCCYELWKTLRVGRILTLLKWSFFCQNFRREDITVLSIDTKLCSYGENVLAEYWHLGPLISWGKCEVSIAFDRHRDQYPLKHYQQTCTKKKRTHSINTWTLCEYPRKSKSCSLLFSGDCIIVFFYLFCFFVLEWKIYD